MSEKAAAFTESDLQAHYIALGKQHTGKIVSSEYGQFLFATLHLRPGARTVIAAFSKDLDTVT